MRREELLERVGEQEEADPQEEVHVRPAFSPTSGVVNGREVRDTRHQWSSEFDHPFR
jgi:hypothetical protein